MDLARRKLCSWFLLPTGCSGGVERYRLEGASPGFDEGGWVGFIMKAVELDSDLWGYCNPPGTSGIEWSEVERAWVSEESMLVRDEIANFSLSLSLIMFPFPLPVLTIPLASSLSPSLDKDSNRHVICIIAALNLLPLAREFLPPSQSHGWNCK